MTGGCDEAAAERRDKELASALARHKAERLAAEVQATRTTDKFEQSRVCELREESVDAVQDMIALLKEDLHRLDIDETDQPLRMHKDDLCLIRSLGGQKGLNDFVALPEPAQRPLLLALDAMKTLFRSLPLDEK